LYFDEPIIYLETKRRYNKMTKPAHSISIDEIFKTFSSSKEGLTDQEVENRFKKYGKNVLDEKKISKWVIFFRQFHNILIYVLVIASIVSISIGEWIDFIVINIIILINGFLGFFEELKAESSLQALKKMVESRNKVIRNGKTIDIPSSELVPGDFIVLHEGEVVTADLRLVESHGLMSDESSITGESMPVVKDHEKLLEEETPPYKLKNMLLSGTTVVRGTGKGVIVKTGKETYFASIAKKAEEKSPETPLVKSLNFFAKRYAFFLIGLFLVMGIVGIFQNRSILELFYILLAGLVSAVPEGLPIVITLVMVIGVVFLSRKKAIIRYLPSVETLGSVTVIASDKTGTITEGKLVVKETYAEDEIHLKLIAALCNDAHEKTGDPIDVALAHWVEDFNKIRDENPRQWSYSFDARLKLMASVNKVNGEDRLFIKGAFEELKAKDGNTDKFEKKMEAYLKEGLRVLAFAEAKWENNKDPASWKVKLVGLIGFLDPPQKDVKSAIDFAAKAGIRTIMITGDHPQTAKEIAKEVGICSEKDQVLTGKDFKQLSDEELTEKIKYSPVLARILPEDKYRIVELLQKNNEIVGVTGDGVNDVPALKKADIGIAMGRGTEAAKSVAEMVITDNNLHIIIDAVKNARVIADNIRKVIYYLVSTSLQEIILISLTIFSFLPLPLTAIQILWINLVSDGVLDKTFPFAKAEGDVMKRKPLAPQKKFFSLAQIVRIAIFGAGLGVFCYFLYLYLLDKYPYESVTTIVFTSVVLAQWANGIQAQKETEPFFRHFIRSFSINPYIFIGLGAGIALQWVAVYLLPTVFHTVPLTIDQWKYPIISFFVAFGLVEVRKWIEKFFGLFKERLIKS